MIKARKSMSNVRIWVARKRVHNSLLQTGGEATLDPPFSLCRDCRDCPLHVITFTRISNSNRLKTCGIKFEWCYRCIHLKRNIAAHKLHNEVCKKLPCLIQQFFTSSVTFPRAKRAADKSPDEQLLEVAS